MRKHRNWVSSLGLSCALSVLLVAQGTAQNTTLTRGAPNDVDMSAAVLQAGVGLYREAVARGDLVGAVVLVARNGKVVLHEAVGLRNREANLPMEKNTMFRMASNTKPVIATALAILAERGKIKYEDPVRTYIPSFDNYKSGFITVQHLLSHTSGLRIPTLFIAPYMTKSAQHPDAPSLKLEAARFGEVGATVTPGTTYSYSNPGFNTLGALIEITSGKPLDVFLREEIYQPLGMSDTYNHEIASKLDGKLDRMGAVYYTQKEGQWVAAWKPGDQPEVPFVRASGGLISTAWDYALFLQTFLNGGAYGSVRLIKPETVKLMTTAHTPVVPGSISGYGNGWQLDGNGIYSHGGSDGTYAWVDPSRNIIGLIFTQTPRGRNPSAKFMELVRLAIIDAPRPRT